MREKRGGATLGRQGSGATAESRGRGQAQRPAQRSGVGEHSKGGGAKIYFPLDQGGDRAFIRYGVG
jgi:hypothetical protein